MRILLGSYRIGQTRRNLSEATIVTIEKGPFKGKKIRFPTSDSDVISNHPSLPPITRHSDSLLDLTPFILYDEVIIDASCFRTLLDSKVPLKGLVVPQKTRAILERLAELGIVKVIDTHPVLENVKANKILQEMTVYDLQDPNILDALRESINLWIEFRRDVLRRDKSDIARFKKYIELIEKGDVSDSLLRVLFHSVLDVNKTLYLSNGLETEIYDWEDYSFYYRYKLSRAAEIYETEDKLDKTKKLFSVFIPNFYIDSIEQLIEIRSNPRLDSVRRLIASNEIETFDEDFVQNARLDVLEINATISGYLKIIEWFIKPIELIPFAGGLAAKAAMEVSEKYIKHKLEKGHAWKLFFMDMRKIYNRNEVLDFKTFTL